MAEKEEKIGVRATLFTKSLPDGNGDVLSADAVPDYSGTFAGAVVRAGFGGPVIGHVVEAHLSPDKDALIATTAIRRDVAEKLMYRPFADRSFEAKTTLDEKDGMPWPRAEIGVKASKSPNVFNRSSEIRELDDPSLDRRDYQALKVEALAGLTFPAGNPVVAEAFFGGLYTGNQIAKTRLRGAHARAMAKTRRRLQDALCAALKKHFAGTPEGERVLGEAKKVIFGVEDHLDAEENAGG